MFLSAASAALREALYAGKLGEPGDVREAGEDLMAGNFKTVGQAEKAETESVDAN